MNTIVTNEQTVRQVLGMMKTHTTFWLSDRYAKKLKVWNTTLLYLEAILQRRNSVEAIAEHLASTPWMQEWTGLAAIHPSSLNRRLSQLPTDLLRQTYEELVSIYAQRFGLPRPLKHLGALTAVDASSVTLGKVRGEWAYERPGKNAVKLHTSVDLTGENSVVPSRVVLSTACVADVDAEVTESLVTDPSRTYLLDRGYIHYEQYLEWNRTGIHFVARLRSNSKVRVLETRPVADPSIEQDATVELTNPHTGETGRFRLVTYTFVDQKGKTHHVRALTNRWDVSAADIAQMYRYRWRVEIFFKFMKNQLLLKKVYSANPQAVWNQIYLNLIVYLLVELWRQYLAPTMDPGKMIQRLRAYLERPWEAWLAALNRKSPRPSRGRRKKRGRPRIHPKRLKPKRVIYK